MLMLILQIFFVKYPSNILLQLDGVRISGQKGLHLVNINMNSILGIIIVLGL